MPDARAPELTRREQDVLEALCRPARSDDVFNEPASVQQIADELVVSEAAVKQHLLRLYDKFEVYEGQGSRRVRLANVAVKRGAVSLEPSGNDDLLRRGLDALAERRWFDAYDELSRADADGTLSPTHLEALGEAAVWSDHAQEAIDARTRAHAAYEADGDARGAGRVALALVISHITRVQVAVAGGWFAKATRALGGINDCPETGVLAATSALINAATGDLDTAMEDALRAYDIGQRLGVPDVQALGLVFQGYVQVRLGNADEGHKLLDEAMATAISGELGEFATGLVYCRTICACLDTLDIPRALEWTEVVRRREADGGPGGLPGDCRAHRAAIHLVRGEWDEALREAERACVEASTFDLNHVATATVTIGDVHLRRGELDAAADAYRRASEAGNNGAPGPALLLLARGDVAGARASIDAELAAAEEPLLRGRLLPAAVDVALAADDVDGAARAASELTSIAGKLDAPTLSAAAELAAGLTELTRDDAVAAARSLRHAEESWRAMSAPYEAARAHLALGRALLALGDRAAAATEAETARAVFERLGAGPDAERARALAAELT